MAGTLGGTTLGVVGQQQQQVELVSVRVLDDFGRGTLDQVLAGVDYVAQQVQQQQSSSASAVVNMSLGGQRNEILNAAVSALVHEWGVAVVVAAGTCCVVLCCGHCLP